MLSIKNLHASIEDKEIIKGLNLEVKAGEVHAIMGPNGAGKSTLSSILAGNEDYEVTKGEMLFDGNTTYVYVSPSDSLQNLTNNVTISAWIFPKKINGPRECQKIKISQKLSGNEWIGMRSHSI